MNDTEATPRHTQGVGSWASTRDGRSLYLMTLPGPDQGAAATVVFEAGAGATRSSWALVQPIVAEFAPAVVYDRSGMGRSPRDPGGRTLDRMADDLNDLLDQLTGPFILVGHSAGGPIVRLAASRRPERIRALVLVDPTDEKAEVLFGRLFRTAEKLLVAGNALLARLGLLSRAYGFVTKDVPDDVRDDILNDGLSRAVVAAHAEQARTFLDELSAWRSAPPPLGDMPITVISGGRPGDGMSASMRAEATASHADRAAQSSSGRHVIARWSSHYIPFTEPGLIAAEIRWLAIPDN